ncbi:MAG: hypothetical protein CMF23_07770 [Ignavibacteriae bacterium]|nr:hypothetical protein [Ignavibacteriota bacterium]
MLKIPKSVEYALLALRYIDKNSNECCISAKEISDRENIPYELLSKILQKLVKNKIIISQMGNKGGYIVNNQLTNYSLFDIINALEQKIQLTDCFVEKPTINDCARFENCCLRNPLSKIQDKLEIMFKQTNLAEII